jgi:glyoxylase-like metal-dependent hydrolase (beta-lactamase superfamily II)
MRQVADGLEQVPGKPRNAINVYVMGGVIVDAATRRAHKRIVDAVAGREITAHAVTHAHADHQGASHAICETLGIPFYGPDGDADALESGDLRDRAPDNVICRWQLKHWAGPGHPVARRLREGDEVGGFTVLETPGHSPGHVSYWRESDRALVVGDVLFNQHPLTGRPGLHEPPAMFTPDVARNRESIRRLAALEPAVAVFGHGPPLRRPEVLTRFAEALQR